MKTFAERFNLNPCPFCGSRNLKRVILLLADKPNPMKIKCTECGVELKDWQPDIQTAAKDWNDTANWMQV